MQQLVQDAFAMGMTQVSEEAEQFANYLKAIKPHNVMEIGSKLGGMFHMLCETSSGMRISVDMQGGDFGGWILNEHAYLGNIYERRNKYFTEKYSNTYMIDGDSQTFPIYNKVRNVLKDERLDLLFIDADHSYGGVNADYKNYSNLVRPGGRIVFHDINDTEHHRDIGCNVSKLWNELDGVKIEFNANKHWAGIGILIVGSEIQ